MKKHNMHRPGQGDYGNGMVVDSIPSAKRWIREWGAGMRRGIFREAIRGQHLRACLSAPGADRVERFERRVYARMFGEEVEL